MALPKAALPNGAPILTTPLGPPATATREKGRFGPLESVSIFRALPKSLLCTSAERMLPNSSPVAILGAQARQGAPSSAGPVPDCCKQPRPRETLSALQGWQNPAPQTHRKLATPNKPTELWCKQCNRALATAHAGRPHEAPPFICKAIEAFLTTKHGGREEAAVKRIHHQGSSW